jgi:23S rRNA (cytosine1962-C5)-methyltransferase
MNTIQLKKGKEKQFYQGKLAIEEGDLSEDLFLSDGEILRVTDLYGQFIGTAMMSFEQKAEGWILTKNENDTVDQVFIEDKITQAIERRAPLFNEEGTTVFRLFNEIGDGIGGLTIEYFDQHLLVTFNSQGIYKIREQIFKILIKVLKPASITEQKRFSSDGKMKIENHHVMGNVTFPILVEESGVYYNIDLSEGPMSGLFLDQRETRKALLNMEDASAKKFLNLFSYSGSFSVAAAMAGMSTTSVDLAGRTRELTTDNFNVNNLAMEPHTIHIMDTFEYLKYAKRNNHHFDVILIDPPSFSRNKKKVFKVARDYPKLIEGALAVLNHGGQLILSQNLETYTLKQFKKDIDQTLKQQGLDYELIDVKGLPKDFPTSKGYKNGKYLNVVTIQVR